MAGFSQQLRAAMISILLATSFTLVASATMPQSTSSTPSQQDKAKACNDAADKKGLKDQDRKTFMQNCLNKAANSTPPSNEDKATACKNLADKKGLQGADRRSFLKDCANKATSK